MRNNNEHHDLELIQYKSAFDAIVKRRQSFIKRERALERVMPALLTGSAFTTSILVGAWQFIPEQARPVAFAAFLLNFSLSPFLKLQSTAPYIAKKETGPINVSFEEATNSIDTEIGTKSDMPLHDFYDEPKEVLRESSKDLWEASKKALGKKWLEQVKTATNEAQKTCEKYYSATSPRTYVHGAIIAATFLAATQFSNNFKENWDVATDWTPPPAPIEYSITIRPPEKIEGTRVLTDSMIKEAIKNGNSLNPHDQSQLKITTYNRPIEILVNNQAIAPQVVTNENNNLERTEYSYEITLTSDTETMQFENITFDFDIESDTAPEISINRVIPDTKAPGTLRLEYEIADDNGADKTKATIGFPGATGQIQTPVLDGSKFPELILPNN